MALLEIEGITKAFGGLTAVSDVSFQVEEREIIAVIGPNGAGKTTLFNMITGVISPTQGSIKFKGKVVSGLKPHKVSAQGINRTFQNIELFEDMSVIETVMVGGDVLGKTGFVQSVLGSPGVKRDEIAIRKVAKEKLALVNMENKDTNVAGELSYGQQRLVEIARALANNPSLLLLDEPAAGLNASETVKLVELMKKLRESGITILFVEHDMDTVMNVADRIIVLDFGQKIAEGCPSEIQNNPKVIATYLGEEAD